MPTEFVQGNRIAVPCSKFPGAFPDEYLITIDSEDGCLSGFIDAAQVSEDGAGNAFVYGVIRHVQEDKIVITLPGSFFTTTGLAHFSRNMLEKAG